MNKASSSASTSPRPPLLIARRSETGRNQESPFLRLSAAKRVGGGRGWGWRGGVSRLPEQNEKEPPVRPTATPSRLAPLPALPRTGSFPSNPDLHLSPYPLSSLRLGFFDLGRSRVDSKTYSPFLRLSAAKRVGGGRGWGWRGGVSLESDQNENEPPVRPTATPSRLAPLTALPRTG